MRQDTLLLLSSGGLASPPFSPPPFTFSPGARPNYDLLSQVCTAVGGPDDSSAGEGSGEESGGSESEAEEGNDREESGNGSEDEAQGEEGGDSDVIDDTDDGAGGETSLQRQQQLCEERRLVQAEKDAAARAKNRAVRAEVRARAQERRVTGMMVVAKRRRSAR
eukprot:scaffold5330_cov125-Isochrysis_galbana.AAC.1